MNAPTDPTMPEWEVAQWFNTQQPISLADLRGQVVLIHAIPQARQVHEQFADQGVAMIGLHTVFEHHDAMQPHALAAFIHEYGLRFPVGVDAPSADGQRVPRTMARWGLQGTPTTLVVDRQGRLRLRHFGHVPDLPLGAILGRLLSEA